MQSLDCFRKCLFKSGISGREGNRVSYVLAPYMLTIVGSIVRITYLSVGLQGRVSQGKCLGKFANTILFSQILEYGFLYPLLEQLSYFISSITLLQRAGEKKKKNFFWFTEPQLCLKFKTRDCLHVLRGPKYLNSMVEITENATVEVTEDDKGQAHLSQ